MDYFPNLIMQYVFGSSLYKNNTSYLILGLHHASVKEPCKMNCIMGFVKIMSDNYL